MGRPIPGNAASPSQSAPPQRPLLERLLYQTHRRCPYEYCRASIPASASMCPECQGKLKPIRLLNTPRLVLAGCVLIWGAAGTYVAITRAAQPPVSRVADAAPSDLEPDTSDVSGPFAFLIRLANRLPHRSHKPGKLLRDLRRAAAQGATNGATPQPSAEEAMAELGKAADPILARDAQQSTGGPESKSPASITPVVDLTTIAGKSPMQIAALLGAPSSTEEQRRFGRAPVVTYHYRNDQIRIAYQNGRADWIMIRRVDHLPFSPEALRAFGLRPAKPTRTTDDVIRWTNVPGFRQVSMYALPGGGVSHALAYFSSAP